MKERTLKALFTVFVSRVFEVFSAFVCVCWLVLKDCTRAGTIV